MPDRSAAEILALLLDVEHAGSFFHALNVEGAPSCALVDEARRAVERERITIRGDFKLAPEHLADPRTLHIRATDPEPVAISDALLRTSQAPLEAMVRRGLMHDANAPDEPEPEDARALLHELVWEEGCPATYGNDDTPFCGFCGGPQNNADNPGAEPEYDHTSECIYPRLVAAAGPRPELAPTSDEK